MKYVHTIALILLLSACVNDKPDVPAELIQPEKMVSILTDLHLVEGNAQVARSYTTAGQEFLDSSYRLVYAQHGVDMQTFDSSYRFYLRYPRYFERMYDEVIENINHFEQQQ